MEDLIWECKNSEAIEKLKEEVIELKQEVKLIS